jgi:hypothetical protein
MNESERNEAKMHFMLNLTARLLGYYPSSLAVKFWLLDEAVGISNTPTMFILTHSLSTT